MGLRLSKLHECFKKLQSNGVVGQLQEVISQAGTAGSKKRKRDQQGEDQTAETSAMTKSAKKKKKGKSQSSQQAAKAPKWCEDCQTAARSTLGCWNHPENADKHPGKRRKKAAVGTGQTTKFTHRANARMTCMPQATKLPRADQPPPLFHSFKTHQEVKEKTESKKKPKGSLCHPQKKR
jgi:hypothetical protein